MLKLIPRAVDYEAMCYIYPSSADQLAKIVGGIVDAVTKDIHVPTAEGVKILGMNEWVVKPDGQLLWTVLTETEVLEKFVPVDPEAAVRTRGGVRGPNGWGHMTLMNAV